MRELLSQLSEIGEKAEYLQQRSADLAEENRALKARVAELEQSLATREAALAETTEQYELAKLARKMEGTTPDDGRADELKELINEYIREIDQCLKLIGD